jgi:hypothetical protein
MSAVDLTIVQSDGVNLPDTVDLPDTIAMAVIAAVLMDLPVTQVAVTVAEDANTLHHYIPKGMALKVPSLYYFRKLFLNVSLAPAFATLAIYRQSKKFEGHDA